MNSHKFTFERRSASLARGLPRSESAMALLTWINVVIRPHTWPARAASTLGTSVSRSPMCRRACRRVAKLSCRASTPGTISGNGASVANGASAPGKKVVIVGAGWAGFGAAKHLSEQGFDVTLLDAAAHPGGLAAGWKTKQGKTVDAGMKGFWYEYPNIFGLVKELGIPNPFTPFTTSGFWTRDGLSVSAPVFSEQQQWPALIGQFIHTSPLFRRLPLTERFTMLPWLYSVLDYDTTPESYERYDKMSALDMFRSYGVSKRMYEEFIKPTLLVGLFAPPEELSAGATMGMLYFYALQHQNSFDVCWCKGTVAELIFEPLMANIRALGGKIRGSQLVQGIDVDEVTGDVQDVTTGETTTFEADALVFAVGVTGMQKIVQGNPALGARPEFRRMMNLRGIDVVSTRLWLDKRVATQFPANVLAGFDDNMGSTYFNLNDLQDEYKASDEGVIASDFYYSNTIMHLSDEEIVDKVKANLDYCEPAFRDARVTDYAVLRFPKAVTHFSPGSYQNRPMQATSIPNLFMAGDWVKGVDHGANGLSQERAYVTGLYAANLVCGRLGQGSQAAVRSVEPDEPHIALGRQVNRAVKEAIASTGFRNPLL